MASARGRTASAREVADDLHHSMTSGFSAAVFGGAVDGEELAAEREPHRLLRPAGSRAPLRTAATWAAVSSRRA